MSSIFNVNPAFHLGNKPYISKYIFQYITGYYSRLRLLTRGQLTDRLLIHQNQNNLLDNEGHSLIHVTRQMPTKSSNALHYNYMYKFFYDIEIAQYP